ncbi:24236_t:CDS:2 [Dentiscutata erythropus]|uniref:Sodium/hydrogen exchanger n=1 Tax=Dentiscutata erythropus TaxID=1348616 RepID=A0A9N9IK99_9GLOM|nr:24236_t:CDS:2 [Dentiscutata erythropus]
MSFSPSLLHEAPVEEEELYSSWALLIQTVLLILALWASYYLQIKQIRSIHETVLSVFAGMFVGLIIRLSPGYIIQAMVSFKYSYFFNLLLPPIILNSGYEMKKEKFFKNLGAILTFALLGTFISAVVIGILTAILALTGIDSLSLSLLDSMIFGSVLSATDPVTVLTIFQTLKVDPQLYAIIFGESILNDATAIVLYETLKQYRGEDFHLANISHGVLSFFVNFGASLFFGVLFGYSKLYKFPPIESCIVALMAYASYLFSNGCHLSGIVSLLFCGITLKHYAYDNMSLMTKRTTKYMFRVLAQLSENFIFIYLGLTLFTKPTLDFKPFFIFFTAIFICVSRYCAVFPLSNLLNAIARYRKRSEILPSKHSIMLFWSDINYSSFKGLRGAVAFALASGLKGPNANAMSTTILVVVVLSVIVFGGTTSRMLEILKIETGVDEGEIDSDDEGYSEYNDYNHVLTNSQGSIASSDTENINNSNAHWFISFDDKYLKPLFTRERDQDTKPEDRWHHERRNNDEIVGLRIEVQKHPS